MQPSSAIAVVVRGVNWDALRTFFEKYTLSCGVIFLRSCVPFPDFGALFFCRPAAGVGHSRTYAEPRQNP